MSSYIRTPPRMPAGRLDAVPWAYRTRWFRALEHEFSVRTMDPELGAYFDELFATFDVVAEPRDQGRVYSVIERSPRSRTRFGLYFDRERISIANNADLVIGYLFWHINRQVVETSGSRYVLLHAAAAERDGAAVILPARMESGKTTTVSGLLRAGFRYLTDEATAVDPDTLMIEPYRKTLSIDPGSWSVLPELRPHVPDAVAHYVRSQWHSDPRIVDPDALGSPARARLIVSPRYESGATTELEPLRPVQALLTLAENSFNLVDHGRRGLQALADVVEGCECYRLTVGDLDDAVALISDVFDRAPAEVGA